MFVSGKTGNRRMAGSARAGCNGTDIVLGIDMCLALLVCRDAVCACHQSWVEPDVW